MGAPQGVLDLVSCPKLDRGATLSDCGTYRYLLWREWSADPPAVFIMLNPSTADASVDDPTIRKCIGFAKRWNAGGIVVANLYALRSTDWRGLKTRTRPIGPENHCYLADALERSNGAAVVAWGAHRGPGMGGRIDELVSMAGTRSVSLNCLGTSQDGSPRHPLMLPYATALEPWSPRLEVEP